MLDIRSDRLSIDKLKEELRNRNVELSGNENKSMLIANLEDELNKEIIQTKSGMYNISVYFN